MAKKAEEVFNSSVVSVAVPVVVARRVFPGDKVAIASGLGVGIQVSVDDEYWYVPGENGGSLVKLEDEGELDEFTVAYSDIQRQTLPESATVRELKKGDRFVVGGLFLTRAESDAYLVEYGVAQSYYPAALYRAQFGDQQPSKGSLIVRDGDAVRFTVLTEDTEFAFEDGNYTAKAGEVLYESPDDVDGYTVAPAVYFFAEHVALK